MGRSADQREQTDARAEAERLLAEAAKAHREALAARSRARKLAARLIRRVRRQHTAERQHLAQQVAHLNAIRSEFHAHAAAARDQLAQAWATIEAQQRHAAADWAEMNRHATALDARAADLDRRDTQSAERLAAAEAETAGLREEAAAIEQRVHNARAALADLERRRDRARAELLNTEIPFEVAGGANPDDLAHRELLLEREKGAVAALRSALELESADLNDRRRLVTEQLAQLVEARALWQRAERQTITEMEELACTLNRREQSLNEREARLIHAEARRREESHDLWRLRLRLEAWQTRLTASELRWHTEREELEANLQARLAAGGNVRALPPRRDTAGAASEELAALHAEVERLAASVLEIEFPDEPAPTHTAEQPQAPRDPLPLGDARAA
jgi:hypothetical protein